MAPRQSGPLTPGSGRRGYLIYQYGTHFWVPIVDADWSGGIVRDTPRVGIPQGHVYDSADYLLHQPGIAQKRGGTSYAGPALSGHSDIGVVGVSYAPYPAGSQLIAVGDSGWLYTVASGATTAVASLGNQFSPLLDTMKFRVGGGKNILVITANDGLTAPKAYDGSSVTNLGGSPPAGKFAELYKSRLVLGNISGNENRLFFSPTPDITSTWDTTNSWIDCDYQITGIAALMNTLLVFSAGHTERIIGSTPPPNSDMDRAMLWPVGCTDARSIVVDSQQVIFANQRGVFLTNGSSYVSLTDQGGVGTYWSSLLTGYKASDWVISAGMMRANYLVVSITDSGGALVATLMCNVARRAWWRLTNIQARMFSRAVGVADELYYADRVSPRVVGLSSIWSPTATNKNDANGTAVTPMIEFRTMGDGTGVKQFGFGRLSFDMRDAATDNPTMAITVKSGIEADTSSTPAESPLTETTTADRKRFSVAKSSQSVTIKLQQTNASSKTELYALEVDERGHSDTAEGIS